jgi:predicted nucleic acid-binding protein
MIAVVDKSPLNYLILIEAVEVLPLIFGQVHVPPEVMQELGASKSAELQVVRQWAAYPPAWLTVQAPGAIDPSIRLGKGETAAISLA